MNTINYGHIWHKEKWKNIFEYLTSKKYNPHKSWWIEKVYIDEESDNLLDERLVFIGYQLKCEEGYKTRIPARFNEYIKNTFKDERYITERKD